MRYATCECGHDRSQHETHPDEHCYECVCPVFSTRKPPKVTCPKCDATVKLRRDGTLRLHRRPRPTSWARGPMQVCGGSGWTPAALVAHLQETTIENSDSPVVRENRTTE